MPLTGTHVACAAAIKTAREAARDTYLGSHTPPLSSAQVLEMADKMQEAEEQARIVHYIANTAVVVTSVSGVTTGVGVSGPGVGAIT